MAEMSSDGAVIDEALRELLAAWDATDRVWRDAARDEIRRHHLDPIHARAREAAKTLGALADLVREAERACR